MRAGTATIGNEDNQESRQGQVVSSDVKEEGVNGIQTIDVPPV